MRSPEEMLGQWYPLLKPLLDSPSCKGLGEKLFAHRSELCPEWDKVFRAYELCPPDRLKVLLVGQDPYHTLKIADGLAFSSGDPDYFPPSLKVIFESLEREGFGTRRRTNLDDWASQGVMLLNTVLTTKRGEALAHANWGWQRVTSETFKIISQMDRPKVVMAWGKPAWEAVRHLNWRNALITKSCHPQYANYNPSLADFYQAKHFSRCNTFLREQGVVPINWKFLQPEKQII